MYNRDGFEGELGVLIKGLECVQMVRLREAAGVNRAGVCDTNGISQASGAITIIGDKIISKQNQATKSLHG